MEISDLIQEANLIAHLEAKDCPEARLKMLEHLVDKDLINRDLLPSAQKALDQREAKMTTAMGGGFAIPHAAVSKLHQLVPLLARCPTGVDGKAVDGKPVKLFFLILSPADQAQAHLQTLAVVAKFFNRRGMKKSLLEAKGAAEILSLLRTR